MKVINSLFTLVCFTLLVTFTNNEAFAAKKTGTWVSADETPNSISRVEITEKSGKRYIEIFSNCKEADCNWGKQRLQHFNDNRYKVTYEDKAGKKVLFLVFYPKSQKLFIKNKDFTTGKKRAKQTEYRLKKVKEVSKKKCLQYDPASLKLAFLANKWRLIDSQRWLYDFGDDRKAAQKALRIIKHYNIDQTCVVGSKNPSFAYYLANGKAPKGHYSEEDCLYFNPKELQVVQINEQWQIKDADDYTLFYFGKNKREAKKTFRTIKRHKFSYSCDVDNYMTYLRQ